MPKVRFVGSNHYIGEEQLEDGDELEISEDTYERFSHKFVNLETSGSVVEAGNTSDTEEADTASDNVENGSDGEGKATTGDGEETAQEASSGSEKEGSDDGKVSVEKDQEDLERLLEDTIPRIEDELETGHYDDYLKELEKLERKGSARKGIFAKLNERREE